MSSITRKHRRRVIFKCAKEGVQPAKLVADSASREINEIKASNAKVLESLMQAIGVVALCDWGKLAKKETRADVLAKCLYERSLQAKNGTFNDKELAASNIFTLAVMTGWEREEESDEK